MTTDMYEVMRRIDEIQKRFGLKKQTVNQTEKPNEDFGSLFQKAIKGRGLNELPEKERINRVADYYAAKSKVPSALVKAVIDAESGYDSTAVSPKGAMGLMQLMPATAKALGVQDPFSVEENIRGGVEYLGEMIARYGGDYAKALAAYNAGPSAVDRAGGIPDYGETKSYVNKVLGNYRAWGE